MDPSGRPISIESVDAQGHVTAAIRRQYDSAGQLIAHQDQAGLTTTSYDVAARPSEVRDGLDTRTYEYDLPVKVREKTGEFSAEHVVPSPYGQWAQRDEYGRVQLRPQRPIRVQR